jgi:hypothetical protein
MDRIFRSYNVQFSNRREALTLLVHSLLLDYNFVCLVEEKSSIAGFSPSLRG